MPRLTPEDSAPTTPPPPSGPVVSPPRLRPEEFEEYPVFRETFLLYLTDARANAAVRSFGKLLHELILEFWGYWPDPEGLSAAELRSAVADLRHVQGCLAEWTGPAFSRESPREVRLARVGAEVAVELGRLTDRIEQELDSSREVELS